MSSLEKLKRLGEGLGLKGVELKTFISEKQAFDRDEREKQRSSEREKLERQSELEKQRLQNEGELQNKSWRSRVWN